MERVSVAIITPLTAAAASRPPAAILGPYRLPIRSPFLLPTSIRLEGSVRCQRRAPVPLQRPRDINLGSSRDLAAPLKMLATVH